uniref:Ubiquinol-cytochrome c reductase, complex III subunit XI n=2 Tax=Lates calcarifer TaxID=8187 RepID=A0A4W6CKX7_LATCA
SQQAQDSSINCVAGWLPKSERTDFLKHLCCKQRPLRWWPETTLSCCRQPVVVVFFKTGIGRGSSGSLNAISEITSHGVKSNNRRKVRMVQKILNKFIGAKYISIVRTWVPNMVAWGTVGGVALVHFTDWRLILDYVPYVKGKFTKDE